MNYQGKHGLVLGLGESGLAMAQWLACCGATVRVADTRALPQRLDALRALVPEVEFVGGVAFTPSLLDGIDFIAPSPGLAPGRELAAILPAAQEKNIPLWGEIELFAQALAALRVGRGYAPKVIAITGTNGKTTVTRLTGLLCQHAGLTVQVAGNISPAALDALRNALACDVLPQVWVLELSSFQLNTTRSLEPDAATVLNLSQDHFDWHGEMDSYAADKAKIFSHNTVRVLNRDDARVMQMTSPLATMVTFGIDAPTQADCFGLQNDGAMQWLCLATHHLMPVEALKIKGRHNAMNALAALALCRAIDLPLAPLLQSLREYQGEPHRVELVATVSGVEYYDDSKGTNVGATVAALTGLGSNHNHQHLILIAGGDGKGQDFHPLKEPVQRYVRALVLIGKDAGAIRAALENVDVDLIDCTSMENAVQCAAAMAQEGDAVLLSPACASLDMFQNYAHRAQVFVDAVHEIAFSRGEII
jgi:UDP-N-acetylmuramoylalanine--D-glutamate ligase